MDDLRLTTPGRFSHLVKCPGVVPGGRQMPDPRTVIKFQMPHPRD